LAINLDARFCPVCDSGRKLHAHAARKFAELPLAALGG